MSSLPQPSADALAQSARLLETIEAELAAAGGWIPFARYMELALYAPGLGYYSGGARKFGPGGDFITAPELTPLFGQALAAQVEQVMRASARALPTPSKVAYSQSDSRISGAIALRPLPPATALIGAYSADRSWRST